MNEFLESLKDAWSDGQVTPEMLMTLREHFPQMRQYSYANFDSYY